MADSKERNLVIHPQIEQAFVSVAARVLDKVKSELAESSFLDEEGNPRGGLTLKGQEGLYETVIGSVAAALSKPRVRVPPGYCVEQIGFANQVVRDFGEIQVAAEGNSLRLEFLGERALVRQIIAPLDVEQALRDKPEGNRPIAYIKLGGRLEITGNSILDFQEPTGRA